MHHVTFGFPYVLAPSVCIFKRQESSDIKVIVSCFPVFTLYCIPANPKLSQLVTRAVESACHVTAFVLFDTMLNFNPSMHV